MVIIYALKEVEVAVEEQLLLELQLPKAAIRVGVGWVMGIVMMITTIKTVSLT